MKFQRTALSLLATGLTSVSAFTPRSTAFVRSSASASATSSIRRSAFSTTTALQANVLRLADPQSELLDMVDVFIFDCDGVIWRVRFGWRANVKYIF
jgi:hypothetical protein